MTQPALPEPVSWLLLERYALGEVSPDEIAVVERALESDPETRECYELLQQPVVLRPLPAELRPTPVRAATVRRVHPLRKVLASPWAMAALAAAALVVLFVAGQSRDGDRALPGWHYRVKGGDMAIELVRNRDEAVTTNPRTYAAGDRFKVLFTCPPGSIDRARVVVLQGKETFSPLGGIEPVACGNAVPLPGAFGLTGTAPATVCVVWGDAARAFDRLPSNPGKVLRDTAVCTRLDSER